MARRKYPRPKTNAGAQLKETGRATRRSKGKEVNYEEVVDEEGEGYATDENEYIQTSSPLYNASCQPEETEYSDDELLSDPPNEIGDTDDELPDYLPTPARNLPTQTLSGATAGCQLSPPPVTPVSSRSATGHRLISSSSSADTSHSTAATSPVGTQGTEVESNKDPKEKRMPVIIHSSSRAAKRPLADEHPEHPADKRTNSGQKSRGIDQFADSRVRKVVEVASVTIRRKTLFNNPFPEDLDEMAADAWRRARRNWEFDDSVPQYPELEHLIKGFHYSVRSTAVSQIGSKIKEIYQLHEMDSADRRTKSRKEPYISSYISTAIYHCFFKANKSLGVQDARFLAKTTPEFICLMATALQWHLNSYFATGNIVQPPLFNSANARGMYERHLEMWEDAYDSQEIADTVMELIRQLVTDIRQQNGKLISRVALPKPMSFPGCKGHHIKLKEKLAAIHRERLQDDLD
ncbi:hypothetical protein BDD12DRAFT_809437 [Trichophaea hybrida]|nr:hypothetical protein BDD12DRAFT_809437 [Trichophaea hybrida]